MFLDIDYVREMSFRVLLFEYLFLWYENLFLYHGLFGFPYESTSDQWLCSQMQQHRKYSKCHRIIQWPIYVNTYSGSVSESGRTTN